MPIDFEKMATQATDSFVSTSEAEKKVELQPLDPPDETEVVVNSSKLMVSKPVLDYLENIQDHIRFTSIAISETIIKIDSDAEEIAEAIAKLQKLVKDVDAVVKKTVKPHNDFVKTVRGYGKKVTDPANEVISEGKDKIGSWHLVQEQKRRAAEKAAAESAARLQKELDQKATADGTEAVQVPAVPVPKKKGPIRTKHGSISTAKIQKFIYDQAKIPREYMMPNEKKIKAAIKAGLKIPGVTVTDAASVRIRTG